MPFPRRGFRVGFRNERHDEGRYAFIDRATLERKLQHVDDILDPSPATFAPAHFIGLALALVFVDARRLLSLPLCHSFSVPAVLLGKLCVGKRHAVPCDQSPIVKLANRGWVHVVELRAAGTNPTKGVGVHIGTAFLVRVQVSHVLGADQIRAHGLVQSLRSGKRTVVLCAHHIDGDNRHHQYRDAGAHLGHHTLRRRSAARSSVSSRLAKQNRNTGPGCASVRNGDTGIAATPCSFRRRMANSASASPVIAE